jgi:hypothetical protein
MHLDPRSWEAWSAVHQPWELEWQRENGRFDSASDINVGFAKHWLPMRTFIDPEGSVLDIGCGPRPPFAPCTVIDPLAAAYMQSTPIEWWRDVVVHSQPAEQRIPELDRWADTVICWNCLDHAVGWQEILDNIIAYAKPRARIAIATDFHNPYDGHPGFGENEFMSEIHQRFVVDKVRPKWRQDIAMLLRRRFAG